MSQKVTRIGKFHFWWGFSMICVFGVLGTFLVGSSHLNDNITGYLLLVLSLAVGIVIFSKKSVTSALSTLGNQESKS